MSKIDRFPLVVIAELCRCLDFFGLERWGFCCFQLRKNGFRDLRGSLRVFFGAVKLMKFYNIVLLPLVLRMILLIWFYLQKFASVCEARLRICV